jgi:hypothetical protein
VLSHNTQRKHARAAAPAPRRCRLPAICPRCTTLDPGARLRGTRGDESVLPGAEPAPPPPPPPTTGVAAAPELAMAAAARHSKQQHQRLLSSHLTSSHSIASPQITTARTRQNAWLTSLALPSGASHFQDLCGEGDVLPSRNNIAAVNAVPNAPHRHVNQQPSPNTSISSDVHTALPVADRLRWTAARRRWDAVGSRG